ncbi:MAG TPA: phosphatase domain-containing protein [Thermoanaerobaculia bacterium]|nr:phosphatase domain-containing protein [Thermoanaerobaculia bacterium]
MPWIDIVRSLAHRAENTLDRRRKPRSGVPVIAPYRGFGRAGEMIVRGRVLVEKRVTRVREAEPVWRNMLNAYRRFHSAEVPGARVRAVFREAVVETIADDEGHFQVRLESTLIDPASLWHEVGLMLAGGDAAVTAHVLVPPPDARFGIISDIDDTVVQTGATSLRQMLRTVMLQNAAMRTPFEGVADLYRALHSERNPLFYVSSGPWNLYDLIHDFLDITGIPHGPIFLQDWGFDEETLITRPHELHKLREIQSLLDYYPTLPFVLIGDSGQHDPEIYLRAIHANPGRIKLAIIRDVTHETRDSAIAAIAAEARAAGSDMLYVEHSAQALDRARELGLL